MNKKTSFKNIPFHTENINFDGSSRRVTLHEYPFKNESFTEDLGASSKSMSVSAYILGADYEIRRDALIKACTTKGAGTLLLANFASMQAICTACSVSENKEGKIATFSLSFNIVDNQKIPLPLINTAGIISQKTNNLAAKIEENFIKSYNPQQFLSSHIKYIETYLHAVFDHIFTQPIFIDIFNAASVFHHVYQGIKILSNEESRKELLGKLYTAIEKVLLSVSAEVALEVAKTCENVKRMCLRLIVMQMADSLKNTDFANKEAGKSEFYKVHTYLEKELQHASRLREDSTYFALEDMRSALVQDILTRAVNLPNITTFQTIRTEPAIVIAHRLGGGEELARDIETRNAINHAGFVRGGSTLTALNKV